MGLAGQIEARLSAAFRPTRLQVINESAHHAGHSGDDGTGESHWRVVIAAPALAPMSRLERHRAVHAALGPEIIGRIHALAIEAS
ncbi:MAG: BolA/IbaG family iron-sulfur metabolism protein [Limimaricola sp.]|uniref:BolA family protein n=1 Tax=Limimaricola sp. TaxID=2211665 RepID=UPI001DECAAB6|nr:BolA family protein [Limimaricola sp.]MBI1418549.1 BolA/IbaG family iron-sulfur metabolism protein [Limimaricola sp.]